MRQCDNVCLYAWVSLCVHMSVWRARGCAVYLSYRSAPLCLAFLPSIAFACFPCIAQNWWLCRIVIWWFWWVTVIFRLVRYAWLAESRKRGGPGGGWGATECIRAPEWWASSDERRNHWSLRWSWKHLKVDIRWRTCRHTYPFQSVKIKKSLSTISFKKVRSLLSFNIFNLCYIYVKMWTSWTWDGWECGWDMLRPVTLCDSLSEMPIASWNNWNHRPWRLQPPGVGGRMWPSWPSCVSDVTKRKSMFHTFGKRMKEDEKRWTLGQNRGILSDMVSLHTKASKSITSTSLQINTSTEWCDASWCTSTRFNEERTMKRGSSRMWSGNSFCIAVVGGRQHSEEGELSEEAHSVSLQSLVLQFRV